MYHDDERRLFGSTTSIGDSKESRLDTQKTLSVRVWHTGSSTKVMMAIIKHVISSLA